jgi:hypothetical protein
MVAVAPMTACNSASLLAKVEDFQPVAEDALNLFCAIKPGEIVCSSTWKAKFASDYTAATTAWSDYLTALKNGTATIEAYNILNGLFQVYENDANLIFQAIPQLNDPTITGIVDLAEVLLAAIEVFFPGPPVGTDMRPAVLGPAVFASHASAVVYNKAWLSGWIKDFNGKVDAAQKAHPSVKLSKVHLHTLKLGTAKLGW